MQPMEYMELDQARSDQRNSKEEEDLNNNYETDRHTNGNSKETVNACVSAFCLSQEHRVGLDCIALSSVNHLLNLEQHEGNIQIGPNEMVSFNFVLWLCLTAVG